MVSIIRFSPEGVVEAPVLSLGTLGLYREDEARVEEDCNDHDHKQETQL